MTQEFHISVTPLGSDRYLVRTERMAPGVPIAEEQVVWAVDEWLTQTQRLMNDPLLGLLQGYGTNRVGGFELPNGYGEDNQPANPDATLTLVKLGQQLYSALFQGRLRDSWMTAQGIAQHKGELLRLRLGLKGTQLSRLPWEVLCATDAGRDQPRPLNGLSTGSRPIAAGTDIVFSRFQPAIALAATSSLTLEVDQPLRILMAIATPPDQERLALKQEAMHLQQELQSSNYYAVNSVLSQFPDIHLTILDQPGREQLAQALEQGQYHVLHYAGHSNLGAAGGDLFLVNPRTGLTETLSGDDLAGLLVNNGIRMAVFNSCRGAHTAAADPATDGDRNLAEALVSRGIPAVLAMAERIPDDVAISLTRLFYRNLKQGHPIDLSLSRARQGLITAYGSHQLYWALPILYLHQDFNGYLTGGDRTADGATSQPALVPPVYDPPDLSTKDERPATTAVRSSSVVMDSEDDLKIITRAVLEEDDLSQLLELDNFQYTNGTEPDGDEDLSYEAETAAVADLIQQLSDSSAISNPSAASVLTSTRLITDQEPWDQPRQDWSYEDIPVPDVPLDQQGMPDLQDGLSIQFPADAPTPAQGRPFYQSIKLHYLLMPVAGALGALAIAYLVSQRSTPPLPPPPPPTPVAALGEGTVQRSFLKSADTTSLMATAISHFNQKDLPRGQQAVEELLNRGALQEAESALQSVPADQVDQPDIAFLKGRLAWESVKRGNTDYNLSDARRFWETAVKHKPDAVLYHNALGFALYAEGKSKNAVDVWCRSLTLMQPQSTTEPLDASTANCPVPSPPIGNADTLTAIAGLALTLKQDAETAGNDRLGTPEELMKRSLRLYRVVLESQPGEFQPDELGKNWLWTEPAIAEWRSLASR